MFLDLFWCLTFITYVFTSLGALIKPSSYLVCTITYVICGPYYCVGLPLVHLTLCYIIFLLEHPYILGQLLTFMVV
jgi:hypothetical protein